MSTSLHISLPVANRIFSCASQVNAPGTLLGVFSQNGQRSDFSPATGDNPQLDDNQLPVFLHQPADDIAGRYLLVETGTKGVLEISAYQQHNGKREKIPVTT